MIKFTYVTITFNAAHCLERTLNSILRLEYRHIEHIIVDGASTDGTLSMAEEYKTVSDSAGNGHAIRIISEPDKGLYDAMNKGLAAATGDYICFLNAGDFLPEANLTDTIIRNSRLEESVSKMWPGVIYGNTDIVDNNGKFIRHRRLSPPERLSWRSFIHGMLVCHQAFYARTDIARQIKYDLQYHYSADVDWCIRVMRECSKRHLPLANTHSLLVCYTEEGQTTVHHADSLKERFNVMSRHYGKIPTVLMHCWFALRQLLKR